MKIFNASDLPPFIGGMDTEQLLESSRFARVSLRFIQAGALLLQCSMLFAAVVLCAAAAVPALAQGSVLGNDASRPVSLAKRAIDVLAWGMSGTDFVKAVRLIEAYVFRRAICAIPTNSMNKTFATFTKVLKKDRYF